MKEITCPRMRLRCHFPGTGSAEQAPVCSFRYTPEQILTIYNPDDL
jgi:hypothetical protein